MSRSRAAVLLLAVSVAATVLAGCASAPKTAPAAPTPTASPVGNARGAGDLNSSTRESALQQKGDPFPARAWAITYDSTDAAGGPTTVTGTLLVPTAAFAGIRPLVSVAVGTQGLADRCAASAQLRAGTEYEGFGIALLLEHGWAVVVTDYPGLGTPGQHPYAVGRALGPSVLDAVRAARRVAGTGLSSHGPVALMGYSEGSAAAGWAAELQPRYAPDVPLVGAALGGLVADLGAIASSLDGRANAYLVGYAAVGLETAYPQLDLDRLLTPHGRQVLAALEQTCADATADAAYPDGTQLSSLSTGDLFALPAVRAVLAANRLGTIAPAAPLLVVHSRVDDIVPFAQAQTAVAAWCARGTRLDFDPLPVGTHVEADVAFIPEAISWLAGRFAGTAAPDTC